MPSAVARVGTASVPTYALQVNNRAGTASSRAISAINAELDKAGTGSGRTNSPDATPNDVRAVVDKRFGANDHATVYESSATTPTFVEIVYGCGGGKGGTYDEGWHSPAKTGEMIVTLDATRVTVGGPGTPPKEASQKYILPSSEITMLRSASWLTDILSSRA